MNTATHHAIEAILEADTSVSEDEKHAALALLAGKMPSKWPFPLHGGDGGRVLRIGSDRPKPSKKYMRRQEAAAYLGCSLRQIDAMKADGDLPYCWLGRRLILFRVEDLDDFMSRQRVDMRERSRKRA